jgi:hypothetical protein
MRNSLEAETRRINDRLRFDDLAEANELRSDMLRRILRLGVAGVLGLVLCPALVGAAPFSLAGGDILGYEFPNLVRVNPNTGARETLSQPTFLGSSQGSVVFETDNFEVTPQHTILLQGRQSGPPTELYELRPATEALARISRYREAPFSTPLSLRDPFSGIADADLTFVEPSGSVLVEPFNGDLLRFDPVTTQTSIVRSGSLGPWFKSPLAVLPSGRIIAMGGGTLYEVMPGSLTDRQFAFPPIGSFDIVEPFSADEVIIYSSYYRQFDIINVNTGVRNTYASLQGSLTVNPDEFVVTANGDLLIIGSSNLFRLSAGANQATSLGFVGSLNQLTIVPVLVPEPGAVSLLCAPACLLALPRRCRTEERS